jgi:pimeloyl-ACP methyl ester carboxylesterase
VKTPAVEVRAASPALFTPAAPWGARGLMSDIGGPLHWVEFGDQPDSSAPPIVFVHGLGGSHLNWVLVASALASGRRAIAVDLPGFGLSPGEGRDCSVRKNATVLGRFLREVLGCPAVLVGNSMGGTVSLLTAQAEPGVVAGLALVDPALPLPIRLPDPRVAGAFLFYLVPVVAQLALRTVAARQSPRQSVERVVNLCFAEPGRFGADVLAAAAELADHRRSMGANERSVVCAARSLLRVLAWPAAYRNLMASVRVPTLLIHGEADRLVPIAAARRAAADNPDWTAVFIPGVGHTPQLESPGEVIEALSLWLAAHPTLAAR